MATEDFSRADTESMGLETTPDTEAFPETSFLERNEARIGDHNQIVLKTDTGNTYTITKQANGTYSIYNEKARLVHQVPSADLDEENVIVGRRFVYTPDINKPNEKSYSSPVSSIQTK